MVAITLASINPAAWTADFSVTGLDTTKAYDVIRIIEGARETERKYQVVGHRINWVPSLAALDIRDYEASLLPFRLAIYDSSQTTPADWYFPSGPYAGPAPVAISDLVTLPAPPCGALLRSTVQPGLYAHARIWGYPVSYPARQAEHKVIGARFPVFINDRREGRTIDSLTLYTADATETARMREILLPETGRIYPVWLRVSDPDRLMWDDLYFMPRDVQVDAVSKASPWRKWFQVDLTEIDPRTQVPRRDVDGAPASLPHARIRAVPGTGRSVTFTDDSTGTVSSRHWDFNTSGSSYGTSTEASKVVTYTKAGTYEVRLAVSGPLGSDSTTVKIKVTSSDAAPVVVESTEPAGPPAPPAPGGEWRFRGTGNPTTAGEFGVDVLADPGFLRINKTDMAGADRTADLSAVEAGWTIRLRQGEYEDTFVVANKSVLPTYYSFTVHKSAGAGLVPFTIQGVTRITFEAGA